jgi:hypothetical protein
MTAARQSVYDSTYQAGIKNLDRDKARDMEATKQELAERGIPINFSADGSDLYSRSTNSITERYDQRDADARAAANNSADAALATKVSTNNANRDSFINSALSQYKSQLDTAVTASGALQTLMTKYGIDQQTAQNLLKIKSDEKISKAQIAAKGSGGGGGGGGGGGLNVVIGGAAP